MTLKSINSIKYPFTQTVEQEDDYHGQMIKDPYRWLEEDTAPEVGTWVEKQNEVTFDYLAGIPFRGKMRSHLSELLNYERYAAPMKAGEYFFYEKNDGLQNQNVIYVQKGLDGAPSVFLDPNTMSADGTAAITLLGFSKDKKYIAYGINHSGSDWQTIHIKEVATGAELNDQLKWVKFSGAAWFQNGFYYSRYPEPDAGTELSGKNEFHQIWYHALNTPQSQDELVYEDRSNSLRYHAAQVSEDERYLFIYKYQGTSGMELIYKDLTVDGDTFKLLFKGFDFEYQVLDTVEEKVIICTNHGAANRQIVTVDLAGLEVEKPIDQQWQILVPETPSLLETAGTAGGKLFLNYLQDVSSHVYQYTYEGVQENEIQLPAIGTAVGFDGNEDDEEVFFTFLSFTYPPTIYRYHIDDKKVALFRKSKVAINPDDFTTEQVFYPSKDGTKIPMFITYKKGMKRAGKNPTLLYGYGGFNVNITPAFSASRIFLLENGGVLAIANIRGGGEYGEEWHKAGMLDKKQNVFDDFIAAAVYLIEKNYTSAAFLAIQGGSNGGLLVGAVLNQRPELFKVALPQVGVMDMLRYHKFTVGWGWIVEYGSSDQPGDFKNLMTYSPLHTIKDDVYPETLVMTADHDDRVVPAHSFKYIATLQQHQKGAAPVLIRVDVKAGHGAGKPLSKTIDELTDIYSFLFYNMGLTPKF
jgi:prolyl oligopeptidase